uniref:Nucleoside diphosphate kinase n=1 Tax=Crassostrea virginica TaxID=6565 RepID=A0A8B8DTH4_CRAVI|nr:nucleoside diphosphate kinase 6-like [Crassostrea virginica]XP_022331191.1 nucleoside diphosphate kinase 6-like [Crassostrea virginica]
MATQFARYFIKIKRFAVKPNSSILGFTQRCYSTGCPEQRKLQLTLAILKPDVASRPHIVEDIHDIIKENNFFFVASKHLHLTRKEAEEFYKEHHGKFFHGRLVNFMSSGHIWTHILAREDAIAHWRKLMGPTKVFKTIHSDPHTIRGLFGLTDTRNVCHGSDSPENALKEIAFFFPEFDAEKWYREEEPFYHHENVKFCSESIVHVPEKTDKNKTESC